MKVGRILIAAAVLLLNGLFLVLPRADYDSIVVHHSASQQGDFRGIRRAHLARGWFEIGYHLVLSNGSTAVPAGHLTPTWRYRLGIWSVATRSVRHNMGSLHLCVIGNFEETEVPASLQRSLGHAVRALQRQHGVADDRILLHRDCSATACPGRFVTRERLVSWSRQAEDCPPKVQRQQRSAIAGWRWTRAGYLLAWLGCNVVLVMLWRRRR